MTPDAAADLVDGYGTEYTPSDVMEAIQVLVRHVRGCPELEWDRPTRPRVVHLGRRLGGHGSSAYPTLCCGQTLDQAMDDESIDHTWTWQERDATCPGGIEYVPSYGWMPKVD